MLGCIPGDAVSCATLESGLPNKRTGTLINFRLAVLNKESILNVLSIRLYVLSVVGTLTLDDQITVYIK